MVCIVVGSDVSVVPRMMAVMASVDGTWVGVPWCDVVLWVGASPVGGAGW